MLHSSAHQGDPWAVAFDEPEATDARIFRGYARRQVTQRPTQIARSGLAVVAPSPHRTTPQLAIDRSAEPAICARQGSLLGPWQRGRTYSGCRDVSRPFPCSTHQG